MHRKLHLRRSTPVVALCATSAALLAFALPATASAAPPVSVESMPGYAAPETPESLDKVGVIKIGQPSAKNVLVLEPGTSAAGAYFVPFAKWVAEALPSWQVWAVVRRESLLEDQSELNLAKEGKATAEQVFNYYIGFLSNPKIEHHLSVTGSLGFAKKWGMKVAVEDLHRVIEAAHKLGGAVVLGGHSLGGSVVTAYATWNFGGRPGADGLSGLVYDDGGSGLEPITEAKTKEELKKPEEGSSWLSFGGIQAPFAGIFAVTGAAGTQLEPNGISLASTSPVVSANLKPPNPPCKEVTNEAEFGFGVDVGTAPESLTAAQAHVGHLVEPATEGLCTWSGEGALTPIHRYAEMFYGEGLIGQDGSEWYFPARLTLDTGAVAEGNENPAQKLLELEATEGHNLPKSLKILAIDSELDKKLIAPRASLISAEVLAAQSGIPTQNLTLIEAEETYAHNDPAGAFPHNVFFEALVPFLGGMTVQQRELKNWVVSGTITPTKLRQPITLPEGSTFNGSAEVNTATGAGSVEGSLTIPPFAYTTRLFGLLPTTFSLTLTQVGAVKGTVAASETTPGDETLTLPVQLSMGVTSLKLLGLTIPAQCATAEPISLNLTATLTREELLEHGWSFSGTTALPRIKCEGLLGNLFSGLLTILISSPENPYSIKVTAPGG
jgi:pimeloyl-ACP methyl ester carboxylesterase